LYVTRQHTPTAVAFAALLALSIGCGAAPQPVVIPDGEMDLLREKHNEDPLNEPAMPMTGQTALKADTASSAAQLVAPTTVGQLPSAPADALWGDGRGFTQHEAVQDGRRVVSEQIIARLSSVSRSFAEDDDGKLSHGISVAVKTASDFEHAALIKTIGVSREDGEFVARVALKRADAIHAYEQDMRASRDALGRMGPALQRAIEANDSAILLKTDWSPARLMVKQRHRAQILTTLGKRSAVAWPAGLQALSKRAALARSQAVIVLKVDGDGSPALRRAVVGEIGRLLTARGCRFQQGAATSAGQGPVALAHLRLATSDSREAGVLFRAVGFELSITDATSGSPVFHFSGLPEIAHGGGTTPQLAEQGLIKRLRVKLDKKVAPAFAALSCR
jgi:hypothetical protein